MKPSSRRHWQGIDVPSASPTKHFLIHSDGNYRALPKPINQAPSAAGSLKRQRFDDGASRLRELYAEYLDEFRKRLIGQLMALDPEKFERFGQNLLVAYGCSPRLPISAAAITFVRNRPRIPHEVRLWPTSN